MTTPLTRARREPPGVRGDLGDRGETSPSPAAAASFRDELLAAWDARALKLDWQTIVVFEAFMIIVQVRVRLPGTTGEDTRLDARVEAADVAAEKA